VADDGSFNGATVIDGEIDLDGSGGVDASDDGTLVGDDGLPIATTVTDGNGQYIFAGLGAGSYFVDLREVTLPDSTADGVPDLVETGYPVGDPSAVIALSEGERYEDADFGYVPRPGTAAIGDRVWHDTDGDGAQDDGELGIPGVDIIISGPGGDSTITTGADGFWMATGLSPATSTLYSVNYDAGTVPAGLTQTFPGDISYQVTVNDGDLFTHLDYGFTGGTTGAVGDRVWLDLDGDGFRDTAGPQPEPGLEGVTVSLVRDTNGDGVWDPDGADNLFGTTDDEQILETATTDMSGVYAFSGVPLSDAGDGDAGDADYLVDVTDIGGVLTNLAKTAGAPNTDDNSQADPYPVSLSAGSPTELRADFGYTPAGEFGSLGNKVFRDLDGDGERDPGEPGIEGVTLELWLDVDSDGVITPGTDNLIRSAITDPNGEYELEGLPFGDYLIDLTDDFLVVAGFVKTTGPNPGDDDNSQTDPYAVTLASASDLTGDFGYRADPINSVLTIAGTVFEDTDNDAVFDVGVEPEVENATVFLFRDLDADGELDPADPLIGSQLSDVNGDYLFTDLPVGDYLLAVDVDGTTVDDFLQTTQALTGGVQPVTLPTTDPPDPGAPNSTRNDFGFWNGGIVTNPITLAWFKAEDLGSGVRFAWMTATETGNVGFNLYALGEKGLRRLNDELIPSQVIDSLEPQRYELEVWGIVETTFLLEDVDLLGVRRYHGPFERGETRGVEPKPERIPWGRIRDERMARRKAAAGGRWLAGRRAAFGPRPGPGPKPMPAIWAAARLEVSVDGIHRVSYEQLLAAGIDLTGARAAALALTSGGEPVAIRVESGPRFGPGAFIEFVGEALDTLYTRNNVYTLRVDASLALRVDRENRPAPPWATAPASYAERLAVDRDKRYILTGPGDDPWYEGHLLAYGGSTGRDFDFQIDAYAGGPAALEIELWGLSAFPRDPDHHVLLTWNGSSFAEEWFDGRVVHPVEAELPTGGLVEGTNRLRLTLPGDGGTAWDMVALDRLWVSYARRFVPRQGRLRFEAEAEAFEVEGVAPGEAVVYRLDGEQPVLVDALRYVAEPGGNRVRFAGQKRSAVYQFAEVGALLEPVIAPLTPTARLDGRARLLVISHADFLDEIQPLVERRRAEGWSVAVVDVAAIYALQTHGVVDPQALRDFIALAYAEHETEAVLLVGGDTYDYHDNLGVGSISFVPSLYTATDEIIRYAPVDPLYGDVDGDLVPDLAVGRLPARTPDELSSLVTRILEYGDIAYAGTALLSADAYDVPAGYSFTAASDDLASMLPGWGIERVYLDRLDLAEARDRLIGGINDGVALTSFFGHSGTTAWSFQGLFGVADAETLENSGRPTIVTQWGCWNNYHVTPSYNTLGHKLLLSGDRGAAAVLGAATLTQAPSEQRLGRLLFARLGQPGLTLGAALVEAKQELAQTEPDLIDVILGWTLLGDPTLELGRGGYAAPDTRATGRSEGPDEAMPNVADRLRCQFKLHLKEYT
ncbi:MAG: C25 family cysteine peptidase, partial [Thermoanaerobaculia bacterium]